MERFIKGGGNFFVLRPAPEGNFFENESENFFFVFEMHLLLCLNIAAEFSEMNNKVWPARCSHYLAGPSGDVRARSTAGRMIFQFANILKFPVKPSDNNVCS